MDLTYSLSPHCELFPSVSFYPFICISIVILLWIKVVLFLLVSQWMKQLHSSLCCAHICLQTFLCLKGPQVFMELNCWSVLKCGLTIWGIKYFIRQDNGTLPKGRYANKFYETLTEDLRKRGSGNPSWRRKCVKSNNHGDFALFLILHKFSLMDLLNKLLLINKISACHVTWGLCQIFGRRHLYGSNLPEDKRWMEDFCGRCSVG